MLLNMINMRSITLVKTIPKVLLDFNGNILIKKTVNYILNNIIQYPRNYHTIAARSCREGCLHLDMECFHQWTQPCSSLWEPWASHDFMCCNCYRWDGEKPRTILSDLHLRENIGCWSLPWEKKWRHWLLNDWRSHLEPSNDGLSTMKRKCFDTILERI